MPRHTPRPRSDSIRFVLGALQMFGAIVSIVLLIAVGVARITLVAVIITTVLTTVSVLVYGSKRSNGGGRS
jgi:hypothetical protein